MQSSALQGMHLRNALRRKNAPSYKPEGEAELCMQSKAKQRISSARNVSFVVLALYAQRSTKSR